MMIKKGPSFLALFKQIPSPHLHSLFTTPSPSLSGSQFHLPIYNTKGKQTGRKRKVMELTQLGFLEELLAPRRNTWSTFSSGLGEIFPNNDWSFDSFEDNPPLAPLNPPFPPFSTPLDPRFECPYTNEAAAYPFVDGFTVSELDSSYARNEDSALFPAQESNPSMEDEDFGFLGSENQSLEEMNTVCKIEEQATEVPVVFNMGLCGEKKQKSKKLEGQPSKNLMAERRRRKRLNDRLSMLRSIVPKISKMDRTSILGDTIDYMKELLERIGKLQEERTEEGVNPINLFGKSKEMKPNEVVVRNLPKFEVEKRDRDTKVSICCGTRAGLLLSTVNTLEALGLEIQQCVISSFNDFSMQASCSEVAEQRNGISSEDIKQALFRNAGYGGRCL